MCWCALNRTLFRVMAEKGSTDAEGTYHVVATLDELKRVRKKRVTVEERVVVLFYVSGEVHALDHFCYRESIS